MISSEFRKLQETKYKTLMENQKFYRLYQIFLCKEAHGHDDGQSEEDEGWLCPRMEQIKL